MQSSFTFYGSVKKIGAKTIYPVHTEHPDVYGKVAKNLIQVKEGLSYNLES